MLEDDTLEMALTTMVTILVLCSLFDHEQDSYDKFCRSCHVCSGRQIADRFDAAWIGHHVDVDLGGIWSFSTLGVPWESRQQGSGD